MRRTSNGVIALSLLLVAAPVAAQNNARDIRESRLRLEQIRLEKQKLEEEMNSLRNRMRDASVALTNIEKRRIQQNGALQELDFQATLLNENVEQTTAQRAYTQTQLIERKVALNQRLRAIYKRGPLHTVRVLLGAQDFGQLISSYKYLRLVALYERMLVERVSELENSLMIQEEELKANQENLDRLRLEKEREVEQLELLESQREKTLQQYQARTRSTQVKLDELTREENAVNNVIVALERTRRAEEGRTGATPGTLTTRDLGSLNWPVEGQLAFRFGPERMPNGVILKQNGIGISAPLGSPVKAVESGTIALAGPMDYNGLAVVIDHGAGAYTLYLKLKQVSVKQGQKITAGQVVGTVGGDGTEHGPHLEFQVRMITGAKQQEAVDPLNWLRSR